MGTQAIPVTIVDSAGIPVTVMGEGGTGSGPETDPIYTADKPTIAKNSIKETDGSILLTNGDGTTIPIAPYSYPSSAGFVNAFTPQGVLSATPQRALFELDSNLYYDSVQQGTGPLYTDFKFKTTGTYKVEVNVEGTATTPNSKLVSTKWKNGISMRGDEYTAPAGAFNVIFQFFIEVTDITTPDTFAFGGFDDGAGSITLTSGSIVISKISEPNSSPDILPTRQSLTLTSTQKLKIDFLAGSYGYINFKNTNGIANGLGVNINQNGNFYQKTLEVGNSRNINTGAYTAGNIQYLALGTLNKNAILEGAITWSPNGTHLDLYGAVSDASTPLVGQIAEDNLRMTMLGASATSIEILPSSVESNSKTLMIESYNCTITVVNI